MQDNKGKLPGKTLYAGRRRPVTREAGFKSHPDSTGGEFQRSHADVGFDLENGQSVTVIFDFRGVPDSASSSFGLGLYWSASAEVKVTWKGIPGKVAIKQYPSPCWSKIGSFWNGKATGVAEIQFEALGAAKVFLYGATGGRITHKHLEDARSELIGNMHTFAPETVFVGDKSHFANIKTVTKAEAVDGLLGPEIFLKSCNRCARFLPINVGGINHGNERHTLSFSNHCVANHRRPCKHAGFGKLREVGLEADSILQLEYGFQLECRFCKKFEVNAMHNPQRTAAQMKEDGARRRFFELLLSELYQGSPQLRYRIRTGKELTDEVYEKFERKCFKCQESLPTPESMHLDHTRPLALLWPLDEFATALCGVHNSEKRDRFPSDYYSDSELLRLSEITGLQMQQLKNPTPNMDAVKELEARMGWFVKDFLQRPEMQKVRDGKRQGDLLVKALTKCLSKCPGGAPFDLESEIARNRIENG